MGSSIFELVRTIVPNRFVSQKQKQNGKNRMANSVDPDEMAHNEPSHQDLHCLHKICFGLQG